MSDIISNEFRRDKQEFYDRSFWAKTYLHHENLQYVLREET